MTTFAGTTTSSTWVALVSNIRGVSTLTSDLTDPSPRMFALIPAIRRLPAAPAPTAEVFCKISTTHPTTTTDVSLANEWDACTDYMFSIICRTPRPPDVPPGQYLHQHP